MKKVALLLSGHVRSIEATLDNLKAVIDVLDCDVFIHAWDQMEIKRLSWRTEAYNYEIIEIKSILQELRPLAYKIETQDEVLIANYFNVNEHDLQKRLGLFAMIYGMTQSYELFKAYCDERDVVYDWCIRHRFDSVINIDDITFDDFRKIIHSRLVLMPRHNWLYTSGVYFDGLIIIRPVDYGDILDYLEVNLGILCSKVMEGERFLPELLLSHAIRNCGFKLRHIRWRVSLIRGQGYVEQEFTYSKSFMDYIHSQVNSIKVFKEVRTNKFRSLGYIEWKRYNGFVLSCLVFKLYTLYIKIFK